MKRAFKTILLLALVIVSALCFAVGCVGEGGSSDNNGGEQNNHEHTYASDWTFDAEKHWKTATCGCDVRGYEGAHTFTNGQCLTCGASTKTTNGLLFKLDGEEYTVTDYTGTANQVNIPSIYKGKLVTSIGYEAFYGCNSLTSIKIPNSVKSIDKWAFNDCNSLLKVNYTGTIDQWVQIEFKNYDSNPLWYAENLYTNDLLVTKAVLTTATKISTIAFYGCTSITSIVIPDSVISIGYGAFDYCSKLVEVYNLSSLQIEAGSVNYGKVGYYAKVVHKDINEPSILSTDANGFVTFDDNGAKTLVSYMGTETDIVIPNDVKAIHPFAFSKCHSLTSIEIPNSVTVIGSSAFCDCTSLTSIVIPDDIISIGSYAFCRCYSLTSIEIPASVTSIGDMTFYYCTNLKTVTFANGSQLRGIGDCAFWGCSSLSNIVIPDNVKSIGDFAFASCYSLTSIVIGKSVTSIGEDAFLNSDYLTKVNYTGTIDQWAQIKFSNYYSNPSSCAGNLYINDVLVTEAVLTSATIISNYAFQNCTSLASIVISDSATSIGSYAFAYCSSLTSIGIPANVTIIGENAFTYCTNLKTVTFANDSKLKGIGKDAFSGCKALISIKIPDGVTSIGGWAFQSCTYLASIVIPDSVTSMGKGVFGWCSYLETIYCEAESQPSGWDSGWKNHCYAKVIWGYKG